MYNMYSSTVPHTWMSASYLADDEVDGYLEAGRTETDPEKRAAIYRDLNGRLRDLAPAIYAYEFTGVYGIRNGIEVPNLEDASKRYPISAFSMLFKDMRVTD